MSASGRGTGRFTPHFVEEKRVIPIGGGDDIGEAENLGRTLNAQRLTLNAQVWKRPGIGSLSVGR
jgi:hypothetical protein